MDRVIENEMTPEQKDMLEQYKKEAGIDEALVVSEDGKVENKMKD